MTIGTISFATIGARNLDTIGGADGDTNTLTAADLIGVRRSLLSRDVNFYAIVGDGDRHLEAGETAYKLGDTAFGTRLTNLAANRAAADPVSITAHGRIDGGTVGDLSHALHFSELLGFGLANGGDGLLGAQFLDSGDSVTFALGQDMAIRAFTFTARPLALFGRTSVAFDGDGDLIQSGAYGPGETAARVDAAFTLDGIGWGDVVRLDFVTRTITVTDRHGAARDVVDDAAADAFFAGLGATAQLTVGSLDRLGLALDDVRIDRARLIDFDDVDLSGDADREAPIEDGYAGFQWSSAGVFSPAPNGEFGYVATSSPNLGFIGEADGQERPGYEDAPAGSPFTFFRADQTDDFDLLAASFAATSSFSGTLQLVARAYDDGVLQGQKTFAVFKDTAVHVDFVSGLDFGSFASVDRIEINSADNLDGTPPFINTYWGIDDILIG